MSPDTILQIVQTGGAVAVLVLGIWLLITGKVVPKATMDAAVAERDRQIALWQQAHAAERTRADAAVLAAQAANQVLAALHREVVS